MSTSIDRALERQARINAIEQNRDAGDSNMDEADRLEIQDRMDAEMAVARGNTPPTPHTHRIEGLRVAAEKYYATADQLEQASGVSRRRRRVQGDVDSATPADQILVQTPPLPPGSGVGAGGGITLGEGVGDGDEPDAAQVRAARARATAAQVPEGGYEMPAERPKGVRRGVKKDA